MTTPVDIEHWQPTRRSDIVGNYEFLEYAADFIRGIRQNGHTGGYNLFYLGDSRSGKTSGVTWLLKCLGCLNFDFEELAPCGECWNCRFRNHIVGNKEWEDMQFFSDASDDTTPISYHLSVINGAAIKRDTIEDLVAYVSNEDSTLRVVYIDEALRLDPKVMTSLLPAMDKTDAIWLATSFPKKSSVRRSKGEPEEIIRIREMFVNRFTFKIMTQLPDASGMAVWLAKRCQEFGIKCEDAESTLMLLAERSRCVPGRALQVLNRAHKKATPILTRQLVETHLFDLEL